MLFQSLIRTALPVIFIIYALQANAQIENSGRHYLGPQVGGGFGSMLFNPSVSASGVVSTGLGVIYRYENPRNKFIEGGLRYHRTGWRYGANYERTLGYLEIPVIGHVQFGQGKIKPFITLGETIGFEISESESGVDPNDPTIFDGICTDNSIVFGLNGGVGVTLAQGRNSLQLELRATFAVTSIFSDENEIEFSRVTPYYLEALVQYVFAIGGTNRH